MACFFTRNVVVDAFESSFSVWSFDIDDGEDTIVNIDSYNLAVAVAWSAGEPSKEDRCDASIFLLRGDLDDDENDSEEDDGFFFNFSISSENSEFLRSLALSEDAENDRRLFDLDNVV
jgi:hypothetical protein